MGALLSLTRLIKPAELVTENSFRSHRCHKLPSKKALLRQEYHFDQNIMYTVFVMFL